MAPWREAPLNATQGPPLLIRNRQVMERAKRHECESKEFAEFKGSHVHLVKANPLSGRRCFTGGLQSRLSEHRFGNVNPDNFETGGPPAVNLLFDNIFLETLHERYDVTLFRFRDLEFPEGCSCMA
jgi:hypothetical protein